MNHTSPPSAAQGGSFAPYTSFAVAGVQHGGLGWYIAESLASKQGTSVLVLSRQGKPVVPVGARGVTTDYSDVHALAEMLQGVEVVVSSLGGSGLSVQPHLARAAELAKVKLFVPSEFGIPTWHEPIDSQPLFQHTLMSMKLPQLLVFCYVFSDVIYQPVFGFDFPERRVSIMGSGDNRIPQTTRYDAARFLAHIGTTRNPSELSNKSIILQGDLCSFNQACEHYLASHLQCRNDFEIKHIPIAAGKEELSRNPGHLVTYLKVQWDKLKAPSEESTGNWLWPDWYPDSVQQVMASLK